MENGYRKIKWGLFFSVFHINLGTIPILPAFIAWLIIGYGTKLVANDMNSDALIKAHTYANITAATSFIMQLLTWGLFETEVTQLLSIVYAVFELLFIYYLMEGTIEYLSLRDEESLILHYKGVQKNYIIIFIINTLILCIAFTIESNGLILLASIIGVGLTIYLMIIVHDLKNIEINIT